MDGDSNEEIINGKENTLERRSSGDSNSAIQENVASPEDALNPFLNNASKNACYSTTNNLINVLQKDAFLSFWTLTKLAVKPLCKSPTEGENDKYEIYNFYATSFLKLIYKYFVIFQTNQTTLYSLQKRNRKQNSAIRVGVPFTERDFRKIWESFQR